MIVITIMLFSPQAKTELGLWLFIGLFHIVGIGVIVAGIRKYLERKAIIASGVKVKAKIVEYKTNTAIKTNDVPELVYVCRYFDNDLIKEVEIHSGKCIRIDNKFPVGCTVQLAVMDGVAEIVNRLSEVLDREQELMRADLESANTVGRREFVVISCPHCGAKINIANHGTTKCQYCRQLVSYDNDEMDKATPPQEIKIPPAVERLIDWVDRHKK